MAQERIKLIKYFVAIFAISLVIFNWNEVSWIFNYQALSEIFSAGFSEKGEVVATNVLSTAETVEYKDNVGSIEISKIGISAPIVFPLSSGDSDLNSGLKKGVIHYPGSALPGSDGQAIILGHSAPAGWPKLNYDWVFTDLNKLEAGDKISITLNEQNYNYTVKNKIILEKGEELPEESGAKSLVLLSCWPPGKNYKRIGIISELTN